MRMLFLLRGAPGCGKSTWIEKNNLNPYTLSADDIRQAIAGLTYTTEGNAVIPQKYDKYVWESLMKRLEDRMDRGEFVIVDATHYRAALLQQYKKLIAKYRYRAYVIDFTDVPESVAQERNRSRIAYKFVPPNAISKMYAVFKSDSKEVSNRFNILKPQDAIDMLKKPMLFDYNCYKKITVIGDIHGCFEPLKSYFEEHPYSKETAYIFCGDFLDRGIQNREVLDFLVSIKDDGNVLMLEGNHERWLRMYSEDENLIVSDEELAVLKKYADSDTLRRIRNKQIRNRGFLKYTTEEIKNIKKSDMRHLCRRLGQMAYVDFRGNHYFVTHGGFSTTPSIFVPTEQYIDGTGTYEDLESVYDAWEKNTENNEIMIHGHRNVFKYPVHCRERIYNLCDDIEYGGYLRILEISDTGIEILKYKNNVFNRELQPQYKEKTEQVLPESNVDVIQQMNASPLIVKKSLTDDIISYNFTRSAFYEERWNVLTCTARGLFIRHDKIVARSYDKFFNWGEMATTKSRALFDKLKFLVCAYDKVNGYLGIVSSYEGKPLICSKTTNTGEYAEHVKYLLKNLLTKDAYDNLFRYAEEHNCSFVFEAVDSTFDPHIIRYDKPHLVLLDIIKNDFNTQIMPYEDMLKTAKEIGIPQCKTVYAIFNDWNSLYAYYRKHDEKPDPYNKNLKEGVVFCDANGFMVKLKTPDYLWWKEQRKLMDNIKSGHTIKPVYRTNEDVLCYNTMLRMKNEGRLTNASILDVQQEFWKTVTH